MKYATIVVSDNRAKVVDRKILTSGTIGAEVVFTFDERWDGMEKTLVWKGSGVTVDDTACTGVIPAEVLTKYGGRLLVGVYGTTGDTATPTVWADLGVIQPGALPSGDESTDPSLPVWAQLQQQLAEQNASYGKVKTVNGVGPDDNGNVDVVISDDEKSEIAEMAAELIYVPSGNEILPETELVSDYDGWYVTSFIKGVFAGETYIVKYNGVPYECVGVEFNQGEMSGVGLGNTIVGGGADSGEPFAILVFSKKAFDTSGYGAVVMRVSGDVPRTVGIYRKESGGNVDLHIGSDKPTNGALYWLDTSEDIPDVPDVPDEPDVPEKTLTSISATYSGGDVAVGTAVTALTGIVVTAHYSDGSTETVTGYTLSGTIAEGSNTITVSYGGKTTTFTVTGVAESGGDEPEDEWESVNVTNSGSNSLVWYSDDGTTELANTAKARSYTDVFDVDTELKIAMVLNATQYGSLYVGMMNADSDSHFYYAEKFGSYYPYNAGETYERTFTVKAGYAFAVGGWSANTAIESLTVWKKV